MGSKMYAIEPNSRGEGFNPLLPHIAGVMENVDEATFFEIKRQIETDLNQKVSETDMDRALDSGIKLGLFNLKREFKVCREFTTKEIKKIKHVEDNLMAAKGLDFSSNRPGKHRGKSLMDYVKYEREQRRKKLSSKRRRRENVMMANGFTDNAEFYKYLCRRCKKSLEKEVLRRQRSSDRVCNREDTSLPYSGSSCTSVSSGVSTRRIRGQNDREEKPPEKSRLLVEKNPMETEPPYYDIFT